MIGTRAWAAAALGGAAIVMFSCARPTTSPAARPPLPVQQRLLYARAFDSTQDGVFSNADRSQQVGAARVTLGEDSKITRIAWYGRYNCFFDAAGKPNVFEIVFFSDTGGLPADEPLSIQRVTARVADTGARVRTSFGEDMRVYSFEADLPQPAVTAASRPIWTSIAELSGGCEFLWCRSRTAGTAGASGISNGGRFTHWGHLGEELALSLFGLPTVAR